MRISLKMTGLLTGLLTWGWKGMLVGFLLGYLLDKKLRQWSADGARHPFRRDRAHDPLFFQLTFRMLGYLAKADGHVSQQEIRIAEQVMASMALGSDERLRAIEAFNSGKQMPEPPQELLKSFRRRFKQRTGKKAEWLHYQFQMLYAQGQPDIERVEQLGMSAFYAGITPEQFQNLRQQYRKAWQEQARYFHQGHSNSRQRSEQYSENHSYYRPHAPNNPGSELQAAYRLLGVTPDADLAAVKKAFRQKISKVHPDKLSGRTLSPQEAARSKEAAQQLQAAYQLIKANRRPL